MKRGMWKGLRSRMWDGLNRRIWEGLKRGMWEGSKRRMWWNKNIKINKTGPRLPRQYLMLIKTTRGCFSRQ